MRCVGKEKSCSSPLSPKISQLPLREKFLCNDAVAAVGSLYACLPPSLPLPPSASVPNVAKVKGEHRCAAMRFYFLLASFTVYGQVLERHSQVFPLVSVMIYSKSQPISFCDWSADYSLVWIPQPQQPSLRTTRLQHTEPRFLLPRRRRSNRELAALVDARKSAESRRRRGRGE